MNKPMLNGSAIFITALQSLLLSNLSISYRKKYGNIFFLTVNRFSTIQFAFLRRNRLFSKFEVEQANHDCLSFPFFLQTFLLKTLPVINRRYGVRKDDCIDNYGRQCVVVTWRMVIQDPPVHLETVDITTNVEFDQTLYKPFSKSGEVIRYLVWPVLRLYKRGPVLCKGIAQG